jgi:hypothetical protein
LNPRGSRRRGGEDVHRRPKGVGALRFGCLDGVGRWRGGLSLGAQLDGHGGRALGWLKLKPRGKRMGGSEWCHVAGERTEGGGGRPTGQWRRAVTTSLCHAWRQGRAHGKWGCGRWAGPGEGKWAGPKRNSECFLFIQIISKRVRIVLIQRWTYQVSKISSKICI